MFTVIFVAERRFPPKLFIYFKCKAIPKKGFFVRVSTISAQIDVILRCIFILKIIKSSFVNCFV